MDLSYELREIISDHLKSSTVSEQAIAEFDTFFMHGSFCNLSFPLSLQYQFVIFEPALLLSVGFHA